jgi:hypothetical protein
MESETTWISSCRSSRRSASKPDSAAIWLPEGVRVGGGVSEVQAAFVTSLAGVYGKEDDYRVAVGGSASTVDSLRLDLALNRRVVQQPHEKTGES